MKSNYSVKWPCVNTEKSTLRPLNGSKVPPRPSWYVSNLHKQALVDASAALRPEAVWGEFATSVYKGLREGFKPSFLIKLIVRAGSGQFFCCRPRLSSDTWHMELLFPLHHINVSSIHVTDLTSSTESFCFIFADPRSQLQPHCGSWSWNVVAADHGLLWQLDCVDIQYAYTHIWYHYWQYRYHYRCYYCSLHLCQTFNFCTNTLNIDTPLHLR